MNTQPPTNPPDELEAMLSNLSQSPESLPENALWREALKRHRLKKAAHTLSKLGAVAACLLLVGGLLLPSLGQARSSSHAGRIASEERQLQIEELAEELGDRVYIESLDLRDLTGTDGGTPAQRTLQGDSQAIIRTSPPNGYGKNGFVEINAQRQSNSQLSQGHAKIPKRSHAPTEHTSAQRSVIYTDTIRLRVTDLPETFEQAKLIPLPLVGEFVSATSFTGRDDSATAAITLRIRADRRGDALIAIKSLGEVLEERTNAADVTDQLVDLDARIRNEQRIEQELLELLDTRNDDPLKDILTVRRELSNVRGQVERLLAQQASLLDRVALSEIRLTLTLKEEEKPEDPEPTRTERFIEQISDAWNDSLDSIIRAIAWLVRVVVGGAVAWIILAIIGLITWRVIRRL